MSAEKNVRESWAAFVEKARAAEAAGYIVGLPRSINESVLVSASARVVAEEVSAAPSPVVEPDEKQEPESRKSRRPFMKDL